MMASPLEARFLTLCRCWRLPEPEREYRFDPVRRWRFDFAWPDVRVALEVEGGVYSHGRHTRGSGFTRDVEKYNMAVMLGWAVLRVTGAMLYEEPDAVVGMVKQTITQREAA